jgi:predicted nucleic acid-binding protein
VKPYADSSFLVALFARSDHTQAALQIWRKVREVPLPFTPLHRLEVRNAIRRKVFTRETSESSAREALAQLDAAVNLDLLHLPLSWTEALRECESLGAQLTQKLGVRSYDLLHLASALQTGHDTLLTFDKVQAAAARQLALTVLGS